MRTRVFVYSLKQTIIGLLFLIYFVNRTPSRGQ